MHALPIARLRGRVWLLVALLAVLAMSVVAAAGCGGGGGDESSGSTAGSAATYVPSSAPMYFEASTDTDGDQWTQLKALGKLFPDYANVQASVDEALSDAGLDYDRDIKPLVGDRAAVAILAVPDLSDAADSIPLPGTTTSAPPTGPDADDPPQMVVVIELAEGKEQAVKDLVTRQGTDLEPAGESNGASIYTDGEDMFVAVAPGAVLLAPTRADIDAALTAHAQGGDRTLAGNERFTSALGKLPADTFAQGYVDAAAVGKAIIQASPQLAQLGGQGLPTEGAVAMSLTAEPNGIRFKSVVVDGPAATAQQGFSPALTRNVPQDAIAYVGFNNLAGTVQQAVQTARQTSPEVQKQIDALSGQLGVLLGVSLDQLKALTTGEHALVVTAGAGVPAATLALQVENGQQTQETLDALADGGVKLVRQLQSDVQLPAWQTVDLGGVQGRRLPLDPRAGIVYGVKGNVAAIGTQAPAVARVLTPNPQATLADDQGFQAATQGMPSEVGGLMWVNIQEALPALQAAGAFDGPQGKRALADLRPVKSVVAWASAGEDPTVEAFVTITP